LTTERVCSHLSFCRLRVLQFVVLQDSLPATAASQHNKKTFYLVWPRHICGWPRLPTCAKRLAKTATIEPFVRSPCLNRQTSQIPQARKKPLCGEVHSDAHRSTRSKGAGQNLLWCEMSEVVPQRGTLDPERTLARTERPPCCWWLERCWSSHNTTQKIVCAHPVLMSKSRN
jgi:hypothetical protein